MFQFGIVTVEDDLHALAVQQKCAELGVATCHIIEADRICGNPTIKWRLDLQCPEERTILARGGSKIHIGQLDLIWWRRFYYPQKIPTDMTDPDYIDLINNDSRAALLGLLMTSFEGVWISDPMQSRLAENKLFQLSAAREAGFRVPRTLVSQDPIAIHDFSTLLGNQVVIKPVSGTRRCPLLTRQFDTSSFDSNIDESLLLSPAIYQEMIPGKRHLRVHCFGNTIRAALIVSQDLDWRHNLDVPFVEHAIDDETSLRLLNILDRLGLRMGIFDFKLTDEGEFCFLEVNPQGQFLFVQAQTEMDLLSDFISFLCNATSSRSYASAKMQR